MRLLPQCIQKLQGPHKKRQLPRKRGQKCFLRQLLVTVQHLLLQRGQFCPVPTRSFRRRHCPKGLKKRP